MEGHISLQQENPNPLIITPNELFFPRTIIFIII